MNENPWDQPPFPSVGSKTESEVFESVGRALTKWGALERSMCQLFEAIIGDGRESYSAWRAFGAMLSNSSHVDLLIWAAEASLKEEQYRELQKFLRGPVRKYAIRRNEIAHGVVRNCEILENFEGRLPRLGFCLMPMAHASSKMSAATGPKYVYSSVEIDRIGEGFISPAQQISAFTSEFFPDYAWP